MFLIVDVHSRWPGVIEMKSTTATSTIQELRRLFSTYRLPLQVMCTLPPHVQWSSGEVCSIIQMSNERK